MRSKTAMAVVGAAMLAAAPMAAMAAEHFTGDISQLDAKAKTLAVKEHGRTMTFALAPYATIMQGPKARELTDLRVGEQVKVSYANEGATHRAERIDVLQARSAKAMPPSSKTKTR
jgi:hypothetical protein